MTVLLAAILFLAPHVGHDQAKIYGAVIQREAARYGIDPLLVVAVIDRETGGSWNPKARSRTNDFGLMQVHVSVTTYSGYLRRPERLFNPKVNIRLGVRLLGMWQQYHRSNCPKDSHPWWSHYQHGVKVTDRGASGKRVGRVYSLLLRQLRRPGT